MALFSIPEARAAGRLKYPTSFTKSAGRVIAESAAVPLSTTFDIFLSHSYADVNTITDEVMLGLKAMLEDYKYSVYADWVVDRQLSRENVTSETAEVLRERMNKCRSLMFVTSANSSNSKWMPWELGYMDGKKQTAAILPIVAQSTTSESYQGQEYLGIYPYIVQTVSSAGVPTLWVHKDAQTYVSFDQFLQGQKPSKR